MTTHPIIEMLLLGLVGLLLLGLVGLLLLGLVGLLLLILILIVVKGIKVLLGRLLTLGLVCLTMLVGI